jgi:predicted dehydrogenase
MKADAGAVFAAVADLYEKNAAVAKQWAGGDCTAYSDFRRVLERRDIDAVVIATPDHWHANIAILAIDAGKHVYVEKPLAHSIREGQAIVAAANRSKRIVQVGTQHRSSPHIAEAAKIVQSDGIGHVHFVRVWNFVNMYPRGIGREPDAEPPAGLDWDFYCGPAPLVPYNRKRHVSTYRWFWDYSGGYITDYGIHRFDSVHQIMGADTPVTIAASGRRFRMEDAGEMPDVLQVTYEYPTFVMSYETSSLNAYGIGGRTAGHRYYNMRGPYDRPHGMAFYGTNGTLLVDRIGFEIFPELDQSSWPPRQAEGQKFRMEGQRKQGADVTNVHARTFIEVIRNGGTPPATIEMGHRSSSIAHLGNIAFKTGLKLKWNGKKENFESQPEASALLLRKPRAKWNLAKIQANG